jgi:hypothetical protein
MEHQSKRRCFMSIEKRDLPVGTRLVGRHKKQEYRATVVEGEAGGLRYRLEDGREFRSLSSAGSAVMGGISCNGWRFWSVADGGEAPPAKPGRKSARRHAKTGLFERLPDEEGLLEGMARYFCSACMDDFLAPADQQPSECPQGHRDESTIGGG